MILTKCIGEGCFVDLDFAEHEIELKYAQGWKHRRYTECPTDGIYQDTWQETDDAIVQVWTRCDSIEQDRCNKINEMSAICHDTIINGVDIVEADGIAHHYSMTIEDQANLVSLTVLNGDVIPYHADGEECRFYTKEEFVAIVNECTRWKLYHESYFNSLKCYINSMQTVDEIQSVTYGMEIPQQYQSEVFKEFL